MDDTFRSPLAIKMKHLLPDRGVFEEIESSRSSTEGIGSIGLNSIVSGIDLTVGVPSCVCDLAELRALSKRLPKC